MLRFTAQSANMKPGPVMKTMVMLLIMWDFMEMTAAQARCDPLTQYANGGDCCKMCGPGTSMSSIGTCQEPQCLECGENEYQDKYTTEVKCQRQPYCDPNRNFQVAVHEKKKETICMCNPGFHCSAEDCITCVPHTTCESGYGVLSKGNRTHNTVCQKCPKGTYSDETSLDAPCKKWTECGSGQHVQQRGTDTSDNVCEETSRLHVGVIVGVLLAAGVAVVAVLVFWLCKGKQGDARGSVKVCVESCLGDKREPLRETTAYPAEEESMFPEVRSPSECCVRTPVENEDESTIDERLTDNGNFVMEENGKTEVVSQEESQAQTFLD
uniref:tumor necrosis factor receptor superfamily member 5 n=1 Tax=Scatophagus argus TaxID=75038 RepID=UPI001ED82327|nr:tumor necrosis factor receptor superfamily member 5 [Scatophagus argus]